MYNGMPQCTYLQTDAALIDSIVAKSEQKISEIEENGIFHFNALRRVGETKKQNTDTVHTVMPSAVVWRMCKFTLFSRTIGTHIHSVMEESQSWKAN